MVSYFDSHSRGERFVSRGETVRALATQIREKKLTTIYAPPGYGKKTVVEKAVNSVFPASSSASLITLDLFNITSTAELCALYVKALKQRIEDYNRDALFPIPVDLEHLSLRTTINLPDMVAGFSGANYVVYFKEFQNILNLDGWEQLLKMMEKEMPRHVNVAYIITGEQVNAMKYIFETKKFFFESNCNIHLAPLDKKESVTYLRNGFLRNGKDMEEETGERLYLAARGYPMFINRLAAICDNIAPGYINKRILGSAIDIWLNEHEPLYRYTTSSLTANQVNFLRAVCDGVERFSSSEVLKQYRLNSSANVFRLKEALQNKEIVTFDADDKAGLIDPMFELWLKKRYFAK